MSLYITGQWRGGGGGPNFLKKCKLPVRTKTLLFVAGIFLVVIFLFPCDIVVICLCPTQARNQEFFSAGEVSENKGTSINI